MCTASREIYSQLEADIYTVHVRWSSNGIWRPNLTNIPSTLNHSAASLRRILGVTLIDHTRMTCPQRTFPSQQHLHTCLCCSLRLHIYSTHSCTDPSSRYYLLIVLIAWHHATSGYIRICYCIVTACYTMIVYCTLHVPVIDSTTSCQQTLLPNNAHLILLHDSICFIAYLMLL